MDTSSGDSRPFASHSPTSTPRTDINLHLPGGGYRRIVTRGGDLRRGHSDGEVLSSGSGSFDSKYSDETVRDGETWMDFLRHSSSAGLDIDERAQVATRRAAIMAADRKRRLTGQHEEHSRRRSASSLAFGQTASDRMRQGVLQSATTNPLVVGSSTSDIRTGQRITDRPLPPQPVRTSSQNHRSSEIALPRWQPDAEASKCPICGISFSFWYRKHHCRKCGRVVCASCSPHRIAIPRQFIVHSPSEHSQALDPRYCAGSTVIDLTSDNEDDVAESPISPMASRRRSQEVRVCNPCVPNPKPLPHLPFSPSLRHPSYSGTPPEGIVRTTSHFQQQHRPASELHQSRALPSRMDPNLPPYNQRNIWGPRNHEVRFTSSASMGAPSTNRRQTHSIQHLANPPPNYTSIYGSAPDSSVHERQYGLLAQEHQPLNPGHRHRHHTSIDNVPSSSRHRSQLDSEAIPLPMAVPQPVLREEDECPICHSALPPKGPDGSEIAREAHVTLCIESHFSISPSQAPRPPPSAAIEAAIAASATMPSQASGRSPAVPTTQGARSLDPTLTYLRPRRRTTGMVVYHATEKDLVGKDREGLQECVICFEEFAVGTEMGRLECLCKFHKSCIRQWWDTKGVGACPVHQDGL